MASGLPKKMIDQMKKAGLPTVGQCPFVPRLVTNRQGNQVIEKKAVLKGPKRGKRGYVDDQGRIWVRDHAHANVSDHWDVQMNDGDDYIRIDDNGDQLPLLMRS